MGREQHLDPAGNQLFPVETAEAVLGPGQHQAGWLGPEAGKHPDRVAVTYPSEEAAEAEAAARRRHLESDPDYQCLSG